MKKVSPKFFIIILICSMLLAAAGAGLLFYSMNFCYDSEVQHFASGAPTVIAYVGICIASVVLSAVVYFTGGKNTIYNINEEFSFPITFFSVLCACFSIYFGYMTFRYGVPEGKEFIVLILIAFSFLSAIWFLLDAFGLTRKSGSVKLLSFAPALMATFFTSYVYFLVDYAMNAELKAICEVMAISFIFYFIEYSGVILEVPHSARKYAAATVLSTVIGGSVSIALLATAIYDFSGFNFSMLTACLFVALWLLSIVNFVEIASTATTAVAEENEENEEITCKFSAEEADKDTEEDSDDKDNSETEIIEDEDDIDDEDDEDDDDIHVPPVQFDDEEEE